MTPEEQRIAIAEACGWSVKFDAHDMVDIVSPDGRACRGVKESFSAILDCVKMPDYLNDLNAMHEAEKVLTSWQQENFGGFLYHGKICSFQDWCTGVIVFKMAHVTAAQRAEAFLRLLESGKTNMNNRIDYKFKALTLRLLLFIAIKLAGPYYNSILMPTHDEVKELIKECEIISDGGQV